MHIAIFRRDIEIPECNQAWMRRQFQAQPGLQRLEPAQLVLVLVRPDRLTVGHVEVEDPHGSHAGRKHAPLRILESGQVRHRRVQRRSREDGHPVIGLLAAVEAVVARSEQLRARKRIIRQLGLLQGHDVRLVFRQPGQELRQPDAQRIHIPGRDTHSTR
jgi:hypothetical protein